MIDYTHATFAEYKEKFIEKCNEHFELFEIYASKFQDSSAYRLVDAKSIEAMFDDICWTVNDSVKKNKESILIDKETFETYKQSLQDSPDYMA
jgi:hypothetical protein